MNTPKITRDTLIKTNIWFIFFLVWGVIAAVIYIITLSNSIKNNQTAIEEIKEEVNIVEMSQIEILKSLSSIETQVSRLPIIENQIQEIAKKK